LAPQYRIPSPATGGFEELATGFRFVTLAEQEDFRNTGADCAASDRSRLALMAAAHLAIHADQ